MPSGVFHLKYVTFSSFFILKTLATLFSVAYTNLEVRSVSKLSIRCGIRSLWLAKLLTRIRISTQTVICYYWGSRARWRLVSNIREVRSSQEHKSSHLPLRNGFSASWNAYLASHTMNTTSTFLFALLKILVIFRGTLTLYPGRALFSIGTDGKCRGSRVCYMWNVYKINSFSKVVSSTALSSRCCAMSKQSPVKKSPRKGCNWRLLKHKRRLSYSWSKLL